MWPICKVVTTPKAGQPIGNLPIDKIYLQALNMIFDNCLHVLPTCKKSIQPNEVVIMWEFQLHVAVRSARESSNAVDGELKYFEEERGEELVAYLDAPPPPPPIRPPPLH